MLQVLQVVPDIANILAAFITAYTPFPTCSYLMFLLFLPLLLLLLLLQVLQVVPDIADILAAFITAAEPDEDLLMEDVAPLYELLAELVSHASNLPQLAAEVDNRSPPPQPNELLQAPFRNPYLRPANLPADAAGAAAGPQAAAAGSAAAVVQLGQPLMLPEQAYNALLQPPVLRGLACVACAHSSGALALAGLLSWNCCKVSEAIIRAAMTALYKSLHGHAQDSSSGANARLMDAMRRHWALMVLQPDSFVADRCNFFLMGSYTAANRGIARSSCGGDGSGGSVGASAPGLAVWTEAVSWPCVVFFKFLGGFFEDLRGFQGPQDARHISQQLALKVWDTQYIYQAGLKLMNALKDAAEYKEVLGLAVVVLQEAQAVFKERQQAEAVAAAVAAAAVAAAGTSGAVGGGGAAAAGTAAAAARSGSGGAGNSQSQ
jgi:hypothetical protein